MKTTNTVPYCYIAYNDEGDNIEMLAVAPTLRSLADELQQGRFSIGDPSAVWINAKFANGESAPVPEHLYSRDVSGETLWLPNGAIPEVWPAPGEVLASTEPTMSERWTDFLIANTLLATEQARFDALIDDLQSTDD